MSTHQFDVALNVQHQILRFQVSVHDVLLMQVSVGLHHTGGAEHGNGFIKTPSKNHRNTKGSTSSPKTYSSARLLSNKCIIFHDFLALIFVCIWALKNWSFISLLELLVAMGNGISYISLIQILAATGETSVLISRCKSSNECHSLQMKPSQMLQRCSNNTEELFNIYLRKWVVCFSHTSLSLVQISPPTQNSMTM